jgi:hypothetical protein
MDATLTRWLLLERKMKCIEKDLMDAATIAAILIAVAATGIELALIMDGEELPTDVATLQAVTAECAVAKQCEEAIAPCQHDGSTTVVVTCNLTPTEKNE